MNKVTKYLVLFCCLALTSRSQPSDEIRLKRLVKEASDLLDYGNYKLAGLKIDTILFLANFDENRIYVGEAYNLKGVMYDYQYQYIEALKNYRSAVDIFRTYGKKDKEAGCYNNIGKVYKALDEDKTALTYYFKAANLYKVEDRNHSLRTIYNNIGTSYQKMKQFESAKHYLYLSLSISKRVGDSVSIAMAYHNLGMNHQMQNRFDSSLSYFRKSLLFLKSVPMSPGVILNNSEIGNSFLQQNKIDSSEKYLLMAEKLIKRSGNNISLPEISEYLSQVYELKKNYPKAFFYMKTKERLKDSLSKLSSATEVVRAELEKSYNEEKSQNLMKAQYAQQISDTEKKNRMRLLNYTLVALVIAIFLVVISLRSYFQKRKANFIISKQKEIVEHKNKEILDSLNYAKRIQNAQLTSPLYISEFVEEHFIFYRPRDIVSGDFYWALKQNNTFYFVVGDCTGHGVPGAFMSLLNINLLNEIIIERGIKRPDLILNEIRREIIKSLKNPDDNEEIRDGMDCVLCAFNFETMNLEYACANNKFFVAREDELIISFTTKMPVGRSHDDNVPFKLFEMKILKGDVFYFTTDGYIGQFGGPNNKKFKYSRLEQKLLEISHLPMARQSKMIEQTFENWKGDQEQVDDVCVMGIKI